MNWNIKKTAHYVFHFHKNSLAAKHIGKISALQESCFEHICKKLSVKPNIIIKYYLCRSPQEVGELYGDNEPINGCAKLPDTIYAVYNKNIKCVGYHEDSHLISFNTIARPKYKLLREGLAMYFDKTWWSIPNEAWVRYYIRENKYPGITKIIRNKEFNKYPDYITYPIAGAFVSYLISSFGMSKFKSLFKNAEESMVRCFFDTYRITLKELEKYFLEFILSLKYDIGVYKRIEAKLKTKCANSP